MRIFQFLTIFMATGLAFVARSVSFFGPAIPDHKHKQKELRSYAKRQWENPAAVHKVGTAQPAFVVMFVHGFLGFEEFGIENSWNEYVRRFVPVLQGLSYLVYHPGLNQTKEYQSFAQGLDIYQVQQHMERLIEEVEVAPEKSSLCGHSVADLPIVCMGHSNGGATLISLLSQHHSIAERVSGLVVLAPYADIREASTLAKITPFPGGEFIAGSGMRLLYAPMYDAAQPAPVDYVRNGKFPSALPSLFIFSRNDHVVPFKNCELFQKAFSEKTAYSHGLVNFIEMHSGGHNWMWQRVQLTHDKARKEALTSEQRTHEKYIKHQSYLSLQDRSELGAALQNFIKKYVLKGPKVLAPEPAGIASRMAAFVRSYLK